MVHQLSMDAEGQDQLSLQEATLHLEQNYAFENQTVQASDEQSRASSSVSADGATYIRYEDIRDKDASIPAWNTPRTGRVQSCCFPCLSSGK